VLNKIPPRSWLVWLFIVLLVFAVISILSDRSGESSAIKFSEFREAVVQGHVSSVEVKGMEVNGEFTKDWAKKKYKGQEDFTTVGPIGEDLQDVLQAKEVTYTFVEAKDNSFWQTFIVNMLLVLFLVIAIVFIMRQFQGGSGKAMTFGKSRARLLNENQNKITFNDIAGIDEAKEELQEVVEFLRNPKKFTRLGGRIPKGVLLMGQPGTGKTLLARGVAGEAGVPFFSISGSDFVEMFVGVGASRVRDLFEQAKKHAPCIIFIDEIDAVGRHRGSGMGGGHDEREQTLNQLLVEMDGFESNEGVILVAATNRPDVLDPALLRPGRFDRRVVVSAPDVRGREQILKIHTRRTPLAKSIDLGQIARGTPGFSGADLENLVNEAALLAARKNKERVELSDFEDAKDKVLMGAERKSAIINKKERRLTAFHEAGHALVAILLEDTDPVHKVTIVPRGRALGVTQQLPDEDRYTMTRNYAINRIAVMMGGRAAEEVVFGEITSGAGNDIQVATNLARKMVCEWGMSDVIGPLRYAGGDTNPFLSGGMGNGGGAPYSEDVAQKIDAELNRIISSQYQAAIDLLEQNRHLLDLMSEALLEFEVLDAEELKIMLEDENLDRIREKREASQKEEEDRRERDRTPKTDFSSKLKDQLSDLTTGQPPLASDPSA
jgi:cell division protease FtsH